MLGKKLGIVFGSMLVAIAQAQGGGVSYNVAGLPDVENFDSLSYSSSPAAGYGWQNGATTDFNAVPPATTGVGGKNNPASVAGIAGFYVFYSNVVGAAADISVGGPRNLAGPDQVDPSSWVGVTNYFTTSNTGSRLYSFGGASSGNTSVNGPTDRALGMVSGSTANSSAGDTFTALVLQNTTQNTLTNFTLSYDGEKWRDVANTITPQQSLVFSYLVSSSFSGANTDIVTATSGNDPTSNNNGFGDFTVDPALNFTIGVSGAGSSAYIDGNLPANRVAGITDTVQTTWGPGDYLILRWFDNDENGNDMGLGIDNLSFKAGILGDTNNDGMVDETDLNTIMTNYGQSESGGFVDGDLNTDGLVNGDDWALYALGLAEYNASHPSPAPEPVGIGLAVGFGLLMLSRKRRGI